MKASTFFLHLLTAAAITYPLFSYSANDEVPQTIGVTSTAFDHESEIPLRYSAYGDGISPAINWSELPEGTKSLALIVDDPVFNPLQPFVHWVAYNIPAESSGLPEGLATDAFVDNPGLTGMINGANGTRRTGYFGPRPPADGKVHTYNFTLYALDHDLDLPDGLNKEALLDAIHGHVLATGLLTGNYEHKE